MAQQQQQQQQQQGARRGDEYPAAAAPRGDCAAFVDRNSILGCREAGDIGGQQFDGVAPAPANNAAEEDDAVTIPAPANNAAEEDDAVTIGEALEAAALSAGEKAVDQADAAAVQAAEMRATGLAGVLPGGVGAAAQTAANWNTREDKEKVKLSDVVGDAAVVLLADKAVTHEDAETVRAAATTTTTTEKNVESEGAAEAEAGEGVAAAVAAAARINERSK